MKGNYINHIPVSTLHRYGPQRAVELITGGKHESLIPPRPTYVIVDPD